MTGRAKLFRTSTFRLAALYLILFAVSVSALLGYVYWNTAVLLQEQTDYTIQAEVQGLADQYRLRGLSGILDTVQRRSSNDSRADDAPSEGAAFPGPVHQRSDSSGGEPDEQDYRPLKRVTEKRKRAKHQE